MGALDLARAARRLYGRLARRVSGLFTLEHLFITSVDEGPEELAAQLPIGLTLLRMLAGPDRPDYWIARLAEPISWRDRGVIRSINHLAIATRSRGETLDLEFGSVTLGIAYVTDESLLDDARLSFSKCRYVAIGQASRWSSP